MSEDAGRGRISAWIWIGLPLVIVPVQLFWLWVNEDRYRQWMRGELGLVENLTTLFLVIACVAAVRMWLARRESGSPLFGPFVLMMALGCFFFAGEEASWGQHWLGFEPPEGVAARNDQGEFNLHNDPFFEKILDQLPRTLLTLAALIGGVLAPLFWRKDRGGPEPRSSRVGDWIWPSAVCLPAALLSVAVSWPEKLFELTPGGLPAALNISAGETKEFGLGLFLMLYLLSLHAALRAGQERSPQG